MVWFSGDAAKQRDSDGWLEPKGGGEEEKKKSRSAAASGWTTDKPEYKRPNCNLKTVREHKHSIRIQTLQWVVAIVQSREWPGLEP